MKRYAGFAFSNFYPEGGFRDFVGFFDSIETSKEAVEAATKDKNEYFDHAFRVDTYSPLC